MSLREQQNLLAKLYTDERLRRAFLSAPNETGADFDLDETEINDLVSVMPEELEFFAESLFWKRLREAEKLLPLVKKVLKSDFEPHFREFAAGFNPQTIKKHFEDALAFCRFLRRKKESALIASAARYEACRLEFFGLEKRLAVCPLDYDWREFGDRRAEIETSKLKRTKKLAVWLRTGKRIRHFFI